MDSYYLVVLDRTGAPMSIIDNLQLLSIPLYLHRNDAKIAGDATNEKYKIQKIRIQST